MRSNRSTAQSETVRVSSGGTIVLEGFAAALSVQYGCLRVRTGTGKRVKTGLIERAGRPRVRRVVIVGRHAGFATLPALAWIEDVGASWAWLDRDGSVLASSTRYALDDGRLRRRQAIAEGTALGDRIVCYLLDLKLRGQADVAEHRLGAVGVATEIRAQADALQNAESAKDMMALEATAAASYWGAWRGIAPTFPRAEVERIPPRWRSFESRTSPVDRGPRRACDPVNSSLNLAYALLEVETRLAMSALGLDVAFAFGLHRDQPARASGALDVMEAGRPTADGLVLDFLEGHTLPRKAFLEGRDGQVRVAPELSSNLVSAWCPQLAQAMAPIVERVRDMVAAEAGLGRLPTPLTQMARSVARDPYRRKAARRAATAERVHRRLISPVCKQCGVILEGTGRRTYCDECVPGVAAELAAPAGRAKLAELRAASDDPSKAPAALMRRSEAMRRHNAGISEWNAAHDRPDPEVFRVEILPRLGAVTLGAMMGAAGLSRTYCRLIKRGECVPHPRHWEAFRSIADSSREPSTVQQ